MVLESLKSTAESNHHTHFDYLALVSTGFINLGQSAYIPQDLEAMLLGGSGSVERAINPSPSEFPGK